MVSTEQTCDHSSNKELCLFGTPPNLGNGENWLRKAALTQGWGPAPVRSISESPGRFRTTWFQNIILTFPHPSTTQLIPPIFQLLI